MILLFIFNYLCAHNDWTDITPCLNETKSVLRRQYCPTFSNVTSFNESTGQIFVMKVSLIINNSL